MTVFRYPDEVDRMNLKGGEWVDVKRRMSYGDKEALDSAMLQVKLNPARLMDKTSDDKVTASDLTEFEISMGKIKLLELNVVAWSFETREGAVAAVSPHMLRLLDPDIAEAILAEIEKRNPEPKKRRPVAK